MNVIKIGAVLMLTIIVTAGCGDDGKNPITNAYGNPTPGDFLDDAGADIFYIGGMVYSKAADVEWVQELDYTIAEQFAEITRQTDKPALFNDGTANRLPEGTPIYKTDTPAYIAIVDGKEIPYLEMVEG